MREIRTDIGISAPAETVWRILTDFSRYPEWNPFIRSVEGVAEEGARLKIRLEPPGGRAMSFKPTVLRVVPRRELRWRGRLLLPGVFDGEHVFALEEDGGGSVRFVQGEVFRGVLVPALWRFVGESTHAGFEAMNEAMKRRAESEAT